MSSIFFFPSCSCFLSVLFILKFSIFCDVGLLSKSLKSSVFVFVFVFVSSLYQSKDNTKSALSFFLVVFLSVSFVCRRCASILVCRSSFGLGVCLLSVASSRLPRSLYQSSLPSSPSYSAFFWFVFKQDVTRTRHYNDTTHDRTRQDKGRDEEQETTFPAFPSLYCCLL
jgi:hypothetical protein